MVGPYVPGKVEAIARNKAGEVIARDQIETAGKPAGVRLLKEEHAIAADGKDLTYITYESSMKKVVWSQLPITWCISICMDRAKLSVSTTGNKLAVNATKRRKMAHGQRRAFNGKGVVIVNRLSKQVPLPCMQTQTALQSDQVSLFTGKKDQEERSVLGSNRFELKCTWDKILNFQVTYLLFIVMARPKKKPSNGMQQTIVVLAKSG